MPNKPRIAFITGGTSGEAVVSYETAKTITAHLDRDQFDVYVIDITPDGWYYKNGATTLLVNRADFTLSIDKNTTIHFDAALIGIHGTPGEDGKLQGYLDLLGIPYTSCDATTSALTFNKRYTVAVAAFAGFLVAKSVHLFREHVPTPQEVLAQLQLPVFVKPNNGGSSIGMSKVTLMEDLGPAIEKAFAEDRQVLVEELIPGREVTIGVFRHRGEIITLPMTEIIPSKDFFDFEAKYVPGVSKEITPAEVGPVATQKVQDAARRAYEIFNCRGIVRIDWILHQDTGEPFLLEINTVPGQTFNSLVPQQLRAAGWSLTAFYTALIEEALAMKDLPVV